MSDTFEEEGVEAGIIEVPVVIYTQVGAFVVSDVYGWQWIDHDSLMAHGHWSGETKVRDIIFPKTSVKHIELDFEQLAKWHADQLTSSLEQGGGDIQPVDDDPIHED